MLRYLDYNQIQLLQIKAAVKLLGNIQVSVSFTLFLGRGLLLIVNRGPIQYSICRSQKFGMIITPKDFSSISTNKVD